MGYPIILKDVAIIILGAAVDEKTECCYTKTEKSQNGGYLLVFFSNISQTSKARRLRFPLIDLAKNSAQNHPSFNF